MTLREQIIKRLQDESFEPNVFKHPDWGKAADWVIRQMEYVAFKTAHDFRSSEGFDDEADAYKDGLNHVELAPDDWKVPE